MEEKSGMGQIVDVTEHFIFYDKYVDFRDVVYLAQFLQDLGITGKYEELMCVHRTAFTRIVLHVGAGEQHAPLLPDETIKNMNDGIIVDEIKEQVGAEIASHGHIVSLELLDHVNNLLSSAGRTEQITYEQLITQRAMKNLVIAQ